ncbi:MAG: hypothetical protein ACREAK_10955 [Nitrosarchaeum sp.]
MSEDPNFTFKNYKIIILRFEREKKKLQKQIRQLKKENLRLRRQLHQIEKKKKIEGINISKQEKTLRAKIYFKINSEDEIKDLAIFSELYRDLEKLAEENKVKLEYKLKKGSIEVTLIAAFLVGLAARFTGDFIMRAINRIKSKPFVEVTKLDNVAKELIVRHNHENLQRSFKGFVEKTVIDEDGRKGTRYVIRDEGDHDWSYNVFDNGDFRALP